jgi:hypothetical protein
MENQTNPEQSGTEQMGQGQNPQELLNASMLFARALGLIFQENEGIVVNVMGDVNLGDDAKKVIVFKQNDQIHIFRCDEDIEEGMAVNLGPNPNEESTQEPETTEN